VDNFIINYFLLAYGKNVDQQVLEMAKYCHSDGILTLPW